MNKNQEATLGKPCILFNQATLVSPSSDFDVQKTKQISTENDEEEEIFDLLSYMKGELEERDNNGFKRKHVGVIWDDLSIIGVGGLKVSLH